MAVPVQKNQNLNSQRSIESEKALIASVLSDNDKIDDVLPIIKKDMFYNSFHALVWEKIVMLYKNGVQVDITTIKSQLQNNDSPEGTPASDIIEFFNYMTTPSHAVQYAKNVYEKSELRRLSVLVNKIQASIGGDNAETADSLSKIHGLIGNVLSIHGDDKFDLEDTIKGAISDMQNKDNTIRFGYSPLDSIVGGMRRGEITVIAGRPGDFKSKIAVNVVVSLL